MISADQLIAHAVGDYILQSDWMATEKTKRSLAALCHVLTYVLPFFFLTRDPKKLAVIMITHFVIDRWRLARFVVWAKNWLAPFWVRLPQRLTATVTSVRNGNVTFDALPDGVMLTSVVRGNSARPRVGDEYEFEGGSERVHVKRWHDCEATGYPPARPEWLAFWLLIIADNILHVLINGLTLTYL